MVKLVDMAKGPEEMQESALAMPSVPLYDYGLTLRLSHDSLEKLDLDISDVEAGDLLDFRAMAKVTSVSKNDTGDGEKCCVELQIVMMGIPENESAEYDDDNGG